MDGSISSLALFMQQAGAVADVIDIQRSSVLVCLENEWDITLYRVQTSCMYTVEVMAWFVYANLNVYYSLIWYYIQLL